MQSKRNKQPASHQAMNYCCSKAYMLLAMFLFCFNSQLPALAEDADPFQMDTGKWMSFDRYKDNLKRPALMQRLEASKPAESEAEVPPPVPPAAKVATPLRPIDLPVLPGVNKGFGIQVQSTTDDEMKPPATITNIATTPDIDIKDQNWQKASEIAHLAETKAVSLEDGAEQVKLDIRPSYLPDRKIEPVTAPQKVKRRRLVLEQMAQKQSVPEEKPVEAKSPKEAAACAAIDAYKKQQLEAIQSDRQTLSALQTAIAQLGLEKQLSFMTDVKGRVNTASDTTEPRLDTPSSPAP